MAYKFKKGDIVIYTHSIYAIPPIGMIMRPAARGHSQSSYHMYDVRFQKDNYTFALSENRLVLAELTDLEKAFFEF